MNRVVRVPIAPHLKKFILKQYKYEEPVPVQLKTLLGQQVYSLLRDKTRQKTNYDKYTEELQLELSDMLSDFEYRLSKVVLLNVYFEKIFKSTMYTWILAQDMEGRPPYHGVRSFLKFYNITEEEYSSESAYRAWLRYKNNEYKKHRESRNKTAIAS